MSIVTKRIWSRDQKVCTSDVGFFLFLILVSLTERYLYPCNFWKLNENTLNFQGTIHFPVM